MRWRTRGQGGETDKMEDEKTRWRHVTTSWKDGRGGGREDKVEGRGNEVEGRENKLEEREGKTRGQGGRRRWKDEGEVEGRGVDKGTRGKEEVER